MSENQYVQRTEERVRSWLTRSIERVEAELPNAAEEIRAYVQVISTQVKLRSCENYVARLGVIIRWLGKPPSAFDNQDIRRYFQSLEKKSGSTKYASWQALRSFFCDFQRYDRQMNDDHETRWEILMKHAKRPEQSHRKIPHTKLITAEIREKLLGAATTVRDKALVAVLFDSGCRIGELLAMEVRDASLDAQPIAIQVKHSKTSKGTGRMVFLLRSAPLFTQWLEQHPRNNGAAFYTSNTPIWTNWKRDSQVMSPKTVSRLLQRLKKNAGLPENQPIFNHLFRYSRAYDLHQNFGLDLKEIKEYLGHESIRTTDSYLSVNKTTMIAKLTGEGEKERDIARTQAIKAGRPITCDCGTQNGPTAAFCHKCGAVINKGVARELIKKREDELEKMAELLIDTKINAIMEKYGLTTK